MKSSAVLRHLFSTPTRRAPSWTCPECRLFQLPGRPRNDVYRRGRRLPQGSRGFAMQQPSVANSTARPARRRVVLLAATGGAAATGVGAGVLAFGDDIKTAYEAFERTVRVAQALFVCINDYRSTLNQRDSISDADEWLRTIRACHKRCAVRTLRVLEKNGGIFIKLGQHLSAMNYLLPPEWTRTFIPLQDQCPVSSIESIESMFKADTGENLLSYFSDFAPEPIGAASLAQVHLGTIRGTGERVAVKVQHPDLEQFAPLDMSLTKFTFSTLKRFFPEYDLEWLSSEMELSLPQELDFQREAHNAMRTKAHFGKIPDLPLVVPDVVWAKKRILVMAYEAGRRLDDLDYLDANGIDRDEVSAALAHVFNEMIFGDGAPLHCDPHGGNLSVRKNHARRRTWQRWIPWPLGARRAANFDLVLYDHGLYRDIPLSLRRSYAKMWLAIINGDMELTKKYAAKVANISEDRFPLFASAITGRAYSVVSSSILTPKSTSEKQMMGASLQDGLLAELVQMLGQVPRIILLILKTNDLTRSLDESLHTRQGPVRQFLILARYCARTVFHERVEDILCAQEGGTLWRQPRNAARLLIAWLELVRCEVKLEAFELWLALKRVVGNKDGFMVGRLV